MIDYAFGLELSWSDEDTIHHAFKNLPDNAKSLNQALSYQDTVPMFLDIELKKQYTDRAPEVQLAIWQAAGFKKRRMHKWADMPMPGITINGHEWHFFITFPIGKDALVSPFLVLP